MSTAYSFNFRHNPMDNTLLKAFTLSQGHWVTGRVTRTTLHTSLRLPEGGRAGRFEIMVYGLKACFQCKCRSILGI
jgi:hypothetical protein